MAKRKLKIGEFVRHGDLFLEYMGPTKPPEVEGMRVEYSGNIAEGEVTGHLHKIVDAASEIVRNYATVNTDHGEFACDGLYIPEGGSLAHGENVNGQFVSGLDATGTRRGDHDTLKMQPGFFRVRIQKEYDFYEKVRRDVLD